jgi:hypothetical protein
MVWWFTSQIVGPRRDMGMAWARRVGDVCRQVANGGWWAAGAACVGAAHGTGQGPTSRHAQWGARRVCTAANGVAIVARHDDIVRPRSGGIENFI